MNSKKKIRQQAALERHALTLSFWNHAKEQMNIHNLEFYLFTDNHQRKHKVSYAEVVQKIQKVENVIKKTEENLQKY